IEILLLAEACPGAVRAIGPHARGLFGSPFLRRTGGLALEASRATAARGDRRHGAPAKNSTLPLRLLAASRAALLALSTRAGRGNLTQHKPCAARPRRGAGTAARREGAARPGFQSRATRSGSAAATGRPASYHASIPPRYQ